MVCRCNNSGCLMCSRHGTTPHCTVQHSTTGCTVPRKKIIREQKRVSVLSREWVQKDDAWFEVRAVQ